MIPRFLSQPDPSFVDDIERLRRRYAWRLDTKPVRLNFGYGEQVLDVETTLQWAERMADEQLS